jgi:hypothetical protein
VSEDQAAELRSLIAELMAQMEQPAPPALRQEQERGLRVARQTLRLMERAEDEFTATMRDELEMAWRNVPRPLRGTVALADASRYVNVRHDIEPWEVSIVRWDDIPPTLQQSVTVLANLWRDIIKGRELGRPKKSRN